MTVFTFFISFVLWFFFLHKVKETLRNETTNETSKRIQAKFYLERKKRARKAEEKKEVEEKKEKKKEVERKEKEVERKEKEMEEKVARNFYDRGSAIANAAEIFTYSSRAFTKKEEKAKER